MKDAFSYIERSLETCDGERDWYQTLCKMNISTEEKVKYCLAARRGWTGETQKDGLRAIEFLEQFDYYIFPAARIFLEKFGGMEIQGMDMERGLHFTRLAELLVTGIDTVDFEDECSISNFYVLEIHKNELLIPVGRDTLWGGTYSGYRTVFWGESGAVYATNEGCVQIIASDMFSYFAQLFGFEKVTPPPLPSGYWESYENWDLADKIEEEMIAKTHISYAQKRFAQNGGVPNPIMAKDAFTQWMLSMKKK